MKNLAPIVLLMAISWADAQWNEYTVEPLATDPAIDGHNAPHKAYYTLLKAPEGIDCCCFCRGQTQSPWTTTTS